MDVSLPMPDDRPDPPDHGDEPETDRERWEARAEPWSPEVSEFGA